MKYWKKATKGILLGFWLIAWPVVASDRDGRFYETQIEPKAGENFSYAHVQCWLPPVGQPVNGILCVILHPHEGRNVHFDNLQPWVELTKRYHCTLISVSFVEKNDGYVPWCNADKGSGRALLTAIDEIAKTSHVPELSKVPLIVAGICEAGQFAYEFSAFAPERVNAFLTMGGSKHDLSQVRKVSKIPGLLIAAPDRELVAMDNMFALFEAGRKQDAPWIFAVEPIAGYDQGKSSLLTVDFLSKSLEQLSSSQVNSKKIEIPLNNTTPSTAGYSNEVVTVLKKINARNLKCVFNDQSVADAWQSPFAEPSGRELSFVSKPFPKLGSTMPATVIVEPIDLDLVPQGSVVAFEVTAEESTQADDIRLLCSSQELTYWVKKEGTNRWKVECHIRPETFPTGSFRLEVPIRFIGKRPIYGGISCLLAGRIVGDVSVVPQAVNAGFVSTSGKEIKLRLKSRSKTPIEIREVQNDFPDRVHVKIVSNKDSDVELLCKFDYPVESAAKNFSGFLYIKVKSKYEQIIKVLFYGSLQP